MFYILFTGLVIVADIALVVYIYWLDKRDKDNGESGAP